MRDREHPQRHHEREVVRRDADADADRVPDRFGVDVAGDVRQDLARDQARDAAGELDDLDAAVHLGPGLGERLAVLARDERGQLLEVLFQQRAEAEHERGPARRPASRSRPAARRRPLRPPRPFARPSQNGTRAITWPVDGLKTSPERCDLSSIHLPPRRMGTVSTLTGVAVVAMSRALE